LQGIGIVNALHQLIAKGGARKRTMFVIIIPGFGFPVITIGRGFDCRDAVFSIIVVFMLPGVFKVRLVILKIYSFHSGSYT
jgi:hypothetical protein